MKIRSMGRAVLMRAWSAQLEKPYGIRAAENPSRYGNSESRAYCGLDDSQAAAIAGFPATAGAPEPAPAMPARRIKRATRSRTGKA
ncbi:hypothetical protein [Duganella vulcania]|uniref:Uncharacterized protein n=1 Tax=Duganella vulcania TaxID=2692166 RepID=A0A845GFS3_9BURK|nr:hypothetical protein [Duganella vulcania]MYM92242.1 hypothetical protein [Duganella vulcania]